jgi:hypothetical protein
LIVRSLRFTRFALIPPSRSVDAPSCRWPFSTPTSSSERFLGNAYKPARSSSPTAPARRPEIERVLTNDPAVGVIRHVDAGYERAAEVAAERGVVVPMERG